MPAITADSALAILPFFGPLLIFVCFTSFMLARGHVQHEIRLDILEGRMAARRTATAPKLSPLASFRRSQETV
jgi:hypothetical protein